MKKYVLLSVLGVLFLNCSNDDNSQHSELIGKTFDYLFFETEQECIDAQPDPNFFINCHQELTIDDNENAQIMLTDIMYSVKYSIDDNKLIIHSDTRTFEFQNDMIFEIINTTSLKLLSNNNIWNERIGNTLWAIL